MGQKYQQAKQKTYPTRKGPSSAPNFTPQERFKYIAFNKPYGVLSQFTQEPGSKKRTMAEFDFPANVYPIGRLDFDSEGLILLSDDGRLNKQLLSPEFGHSRTYLCQVERIPDEAALERLASGLIIEGRKTMPAKVRRLEHEPAGIPEREVPIRFRKNVATAWLELEITEGKNRQVRKMTAAVGHPTLRLLRTAIGSLELSALGIERGNWRILSLEHLRLVFQSRS
jgi:23S rRNA pseudouridine2457 synthase